MKEEESVYQEFGNEEQLSYYDEEPSAGYFGYDDKSEYQELYVDQVEVHYEEPVVHTVTLSLPNSQLDTLTLVGNEGERRYFDANGLIGGQCLKTPFLLFMNIGDQVTKYFVCNFVKGLMHSKDSKDDAMAEVEDKLLDGSEKQTTLLDIHVKSKPWSCK